MVNEHAEEKENHAGLTEGVFEEIHHYSLVVMQQSDVALGVQANIGEAKHGHYVAETSGDTEEGWIEVETSFCEVRTVSSLTCCAFLVSG